MLEILTKAVMAAMLSLAPGRDHTELGTAIAKVAAEEAPLFVADEDRHRTTALLLAIAFRESAFRNDAVGDNGKSFCSFQLYGGSRSLLTDPEACVREGYRILRLSIQRDRENPVAWYAAGGRYKSETARRISRDRMWLAGKVAKMLTEAAP